MYKKMLVPLDGSKLAEVVLTYAKDLAPKLEIDVILLYVGTTPTEDYTPMRQAYLEHAAELLRTEAKKTVERAGISGNGKPINVQSEISVGYAPEEILHYAEQHNVDLILMAAHGRSGLKRWTMGSVADKVLHAAKVPVLLVRPEIPNEILYDQWPKRFILVPLDGSELAESVLPHVETLAKQRGKEVVDVVLIRVCEPPTMPSYYGPDMADMPLNWGEYMQRETLRGKQAATEYLAKMEQRLKSEGLNVRSEVAVGKAADEIINYTTKNPFNLIVMATHGRSGFSRLVYGSVAASVLQGATSPILLIKPPAVVTKTK